MEVRMEDGGADTSILQGADDALQQLLLRFRIPASVAGEDPRRIWHQGHLCRTHLQHQLHELITRVAFYVELGA